MTNTQFRQTLGRNTFFSIRNIPKTVNLRSIFALFMVLSMLASSQVFSDQDWDLISLEDGHRIAANNADLSQLSLSKQDESFSFVLTLAKDTPQAVPEEIISTRKTLPVIIRIDSRHKWVGRLVPSSQSMETAHFEIKLDTEQKGEIVKAMIGGLSMGVDIKKAHNQVYSLTFSLMGFTVTLNDLFIANEIGILDPSWLLENHKDNKLFCYFATEITIKAMYDHKSGLSFAESLRAMPETEYPPIDSQKAGIISQIFSVSQDKLPIEPSAEKYLIFKRCIDQLASTAKVEE